MYPHTSTELACTVRLRPTPLLLPTFPSQGSGPRMPATKLTGHLVMLNVHEKKNRGKIDMVALVNLNLS